MPALGLFLPNIYEAFCDALVQLIISSILLFSVPDHCINACLYTFSTWEEHSFHLLEDFGVTIQGQDYLLFEVMACHDAFLLLMKDSDNFVEDVYEIGIGKFVRFVPRRTKSCLRGS